LIQIKPKRALRSGVPFKEGQTFLIILSMFPPVE